VRRRYRGRQSSFGQDASHGIDQPITRLRERDGPARRSLGRASQGPQPGTQILCELRFVRGSTFACIADHEEKRVKGGQGGSFPTLRVENGSVYIFVYISPLPFYPLPLGIGPPSSPSPLRQRRGLAGSARLAGLFEPPRPTMSQASYLSGPPAWRTSCR
jgi:hypothetical protein